MSTQTFPKEEIRLSESPSTFLCYGGKLTREQLALVATPPGTAAHRPIPRLREHGFLQRPPAVLAKHSKNFSLQNALSIGVDEMLRNFDGMRMQVEAWRESQLSDVLQTEGTAQPAQRGGRSHAPGMRMALSKTHSAIVRCINSSPCILRHAGVLPYANHLTWNCAEYISESPVTVKLRLYVPVLSAFVLRLYMYPPVLPRVESKRKSLSGLAFPEY